MRLYLGKNQKNIDKNKEAGNEKLPYFTLSIPPEVDGAPWIELAAFWKSKSGNGYNGIVNKNIRLEAITINTTLRPDEIPKD